MNYRKFFEDEKKFNQINLFDDTEEKINLYSALDKIRMRFGSDAIGRAVGLKEKRDDT